MLLTGVIEYCMLLGKDRQFLSCLKAGVSLPHYNGKGYLVLSTGNKTEVALGYCTLYGDMSGGLAVIGDLNKERVYNLAGYINTKENKELIPETIIERPPSAELTANQTDENSIGIPYSILVPLVDDIVEGMSHVDLLEKYKEKHVDKVKKMIKVAEYKRRQAPPSIKVTKKSFGIGRRIPMSHGYEK